MVPEHSVCNCAASHYYRRVSERILCATSHHCFKYWAGQLPRCHIHGILAQVAQGAARVQASMLVQNGRPAAAQEALEAAAAHNFSIKAWPAFHIMQGYVLLSQAEVRTPLDPCAPHRGHYCNVRDEFHTLAWSAHIQ